MIIIIIDGFKKWNLKEKRIVVETSSVLDPKRVFLLCQIWFKDCYP